MRGESEVRGGGLKPNFYQLPRPWSVTMGVFHFQGKTHMVELGIEPGISCLVVRSSDHQITRLRDVGSIVFPAYGNFARIESYTVRGTSSSVRNVRVLNRNIVVVIIIVINFKY